MLPNALAIEGIFIEYLTGFIQITKFLLIAQTTIVIKFSDNTAFLCPTSLKKGTIISWNFFF